MGQKIPEYDRHHLIPRSRAEEGFEVSHPDNITKIRVKAHVALHSLFENQLPHEQLGRRYDLHESILSKEVKERLLAIIALEHQRFYKKHLVK